MTHKDILFLLPPGFHGNDRLEYCPECAEVWGLVHYYPALLPALEIRYEQIARPRPGLTALLGEGNQNCPTLILAETSEPGPHASIKTHNGHRFLDNARDIGKYFAHRYNTPFPRGS